MVPWGRSLDEYTKMFDLSPRDLRGRTLDCAAGPASFNAEATAAGYRVVSSDPLYRFSAQEIRHRVRKAPGRSWRTPTPTGTASCGARSALPGTSAGSGWRPAMRRFLLDFPSGFAEGRYRADALPQPAFDKDEFDLALCSHSLFLYPDHLSADFHVASIREICRVAAEARVFPLLGAYGAPSPHVKPVIDALGDLGYAAEVRRVPYEFPRGGNEMLCVTRP